MVNDVIAITVRVTGVPETLGVPNFIGGSVASTLYGMLRTTQDSDIIADFRPETLPLFIEALQGEFYMDDEMIAEAIAQHSSFNIIHRESMLSHGRRSLGTPMSRCAWDHFGASRVARYGLFRSYGPRAQGRGFAGARSNQYLTSLCRCKEFELYAMRFALMIEAY
jgi:hypothetical protein